LWASRQKLPRGSSAYYIAKVLRLVPMSSNFLALAPIWYVAFLFSTVCHEAAHALVAKWGGDPTAYAGGQVTIDPIPHLKREPFGLIVIPIITLLASGGGSMFGWGSAPFDPFWQIRYPRRAALMALAGPIANFLLAIVAACLMYIGLSSGYFELSVTALVSASDGGMLGGVAQLLSILFTLNIILGVFNLIPVPPLDGYSVLGLFLPEETFLKFLEVVRNPAFSLFGVLIAYQLFPVLVYPVLTFAVRLFLSPLLG
jgi:Zn-dependent protease